MTGPARRRQLVDVGRGLFAAKGRDGATIEEVATKAGVTKPVIYEHFGSKEGLYRVVVEEESGHLLLAIGDSLGGETGPRVLFERAAMAFLTYIEERGDGFRILVRDAPPGDGAGALARVLERITVRVGDILADEFAARGFSAGDGAMYAQMLVGMVAMTGQWWLDARQPDKHVVAAHLVNLAWNGLTGLQKDPQLGG
ncbi:TetR/AcrR family transcriptional regulator [Sinomonas susongensis]|uniref:TetR/AcrR family transcriptional regulator n=1 Tax=Sinomonas susongensis TaxID=1324851 RepID=UPI001107F722|nr:TetR/AcrR family transcriptional regulator [Sinomonas susongensis]